MRSPSPSPGSLLVACSGSSGHARPPSTPAAPDRRTRSTGAESLPPDISAATVRGARRPIASPEAPAVVLAQPWATAPLTDVATGETFRIADLAGKVVIVETMAIWCSNCRAQQGDVQAALGSSPGR